MTRADAVRALRDAGCEERTTRDGHLIFAVPGGGIVKLSVGAKRRSRNERVPGAVERIVKRMGEGGGAMVDGLETAMRLILRLFAAGDLVYRRREMTVVLDVEARAARVRRIREQGRRAGVALG